MTIEELNARYQRLVDRVCKMRERQQKFFRYKATADLEASKRLEREVDALIKEEVVKQKSGQIDLL